MSTDDHPVCSTCKYHEGQSSRIDFMWGAGWAFVLIVTTAVSLTVIGITGNSKKIGINSERITQNELTTNQSLHSVKRLLDNMSYNQKRQMEDAGIHYIEPPSIPEYEYNIN